MKRRDSIRKSKIFGTSAIARIAPFPLAGGGATLVLALLALGMLMVSLARPQALEGVRTAVTDLTAPLLEVVSLPVQTAALFVRDVSGLAALQSENARLKGENARLREWHQTALMLEAENKSLRSLLNVKAEPQHKFITARIVSDTGRTFAKSLLVSAGRRDGVQKGQAVLSDEGVIGRVIEAGENMARVLLITDINSRVPVLVENTRLHAIFSGTNREEGRLIHLPQDTSVAQGARIVTSGHGGIFPYGLPIGLAGVSEDGDVSVQPFVDFKRMIYVRIIKSPQDTNLYRGGAGGLSAGME